MLSAGARIMSRARRAAPSREGVYDRCLFGGSKTRSIDPGPARPHAVSIMYNNPDYYPPLINEVELLSQGGWRVSLIGREYGGRWKVRYPPGMAVERIASPGGSLRQYMHFLLSACYLVPRSADIYIGHDAHGFLAARILSWRWRRPVVYRCHDFSDRRLPAGVGGRLVRAFETRFARTADLVIVPDRERGEIIARNLRLRSQPVVVANAPLTRPTASGSDLRQALAARGKSFDRIVLRQGRIGPGHALEETIRSIPMWAMRTWGFVLLGFSEAAYVEEIEALARSLDVSDQLVILPAVSYDDVNLFTPGADLGHALYDPIHVNNEYIATASNKIMEYMAAGLPLLVSNTPGLRALVEMYGCGVTADEGSAENIARAVNAVLMSPGAGQAMGAAASRAFDDVFRLDKQFAPALGALRRLVEKNVT